MKDFRQAANLTATAHLTENTETVEISDQTKARTIRQGSATSKKQVSTHELSTINVITKSQRGARLHQKDENSLQSPYLRNHNIEIVEVKSNETADSLFFKDVQMSNSIMNHTIDTRSFQQMPKVGRNKMPNFGPLTYDNYSGSRQKHYHR